MKELSRSQRMLLDLVLNTIIPPSSDGRLPGAADAGVGDYLHRHAADSLDQFARELDHLERQAQARLGEAFSALSATQREQLMDTLRAQDESFMTRLANEVFDAYYQHDDVLRALDLEVRSPYPQGYQVLSGDLALLAPVRKRGKIYRDA